MSKPFVQHALGGRQLGQTVGAFARGVVDIFLVLRHGLVIFPQRYQLVLLGAVEQQQILQQVLVGAVFADDAVFDLPAKVLPNFS